MDRYLRQAFASAMLGEDLRLHPSLLPDGYVAGMLNCDIRSGLPATRPAFSKLSTILDGKTKFQGAGLYRLNGADRLVICADGVVSTYNFETGTETVVGTFPTTDFDSAYFCQAERYFIVQNGIYDPIENWPIILHEDTVVDNLSTKANDNSGIVAISTLSYPESKRVPIGKHMAYGQGRLFVAVDRLWDDGTISGGAPAWNENLGLNNILAGDIILPGLPESLLAFTETTYLNGGGAMMLPAELGLISGLAFYRNVVSGTGLGPLVAFGREGVARFAVNAPRSQWQSIDLGQVVYFNSGTECPRAILPVNDDLLYRGSNGMRSIRYTETAEAGGSGGLAGNIPLTLRVIPRYSRDSRTTQPGIQAALYGNRVFVTSGGTKDATGFHYEALAVSDLAVLLDSQTRSEAGIWTGPPFYGCWGVRIGGEESLVILTRYNNGWDLQTLDESGTEKSSTLCRLYTKEYVFDSFFNVKELMRIELWLEDVSTDIELTTYIKPSGAASWYRFGTASVTHSGNIPAGVSQVQINVPEELQNQCDPASGTSISKAQRFQVCIEWTGNMRILGAIFSARLAGDEIREFTCGSISLDTSADFPDSAATLDDYTDYVRSDWS